MASNIESIDEPGGRPLDVDRILRGEGWDHPDTAGIYNTVSIDEQIPLGPADESETNQSCPCRPDQVRAAAEYLVAFLRDRPHAIPRTDSQIASFASMGGYAHGPWSKFVHISSATGVCDGEERPIVLFGCENACLRVVVSKEVSGEIALREVSRVTESSKSSGNLPAEDETLSGDELTMAEIEEERRYDDRTFGDLHLDRQPDDDLEHG